MDEAKKQRLEAAGWVCGGYADFLGLTYAEHQHVELTGALSHVVERLRESRGLSQRVLARRIGSTPSQVARIEKGVGEVSLDLMFRAFFEVGGRLEDLMDEMDQPARPEQPAAIVREAPEPKPRPGKRLARSG